MIIQLAGFVTDSSNAQVMTCDTAAHLFTYNLYGGQPTYVDVEISVRGSALLDGGGFWIRNMTAGNLVTGGTMLYLGKIKNT
jgi:hypothetical protein